MISSWILKGENGYVKKFQILGFLVLVLGIIGSFYVAYEFGDVVDFEYSGRVFMKEIGI